MRTAEMPERPDEAPSQRRRESKWLPVLAVLAAIAFVTMGASGVGDAVARPIDLDGVVRLDPAPGWVEVARRSDGAFHELGLQRGNAGLYVAAVQGHGGAVAALAEEYAQQGLHTEYSQVTIGDAEVALLGGLEAVRLGYVGVTADGVSTEGIVVAVVGRSGTGVIFDGFAPTGELASAIRDLSAMIDGAEIA